MTEPANPASPGNLMPHGLSIDTCKGSLLHILFRAPGPGATIDWKSRVAVYCVAMVLFGAIPVVLAICSSEQWWRSDKDFPLPIFRDYATLWLGFVSIPLLIVFSWTERALIPQRLLSVHDGNVLRPRGDLDTVRWEGRFKRANLWAQALGVCTAAVCSWVIYYFWTHRSMASTWQFSHADGVRWTGWVFLLWQMPAFWCLCTFSLVRAVVVVSLLHAVVKNSEVMPRPFHPDRAGGLSAVGKIGLRNQYLLAALGVHLVCGLIVARGLSEADRGLAPFLETCLWLAFGSFLLAGPFVFAAPLLPFRTSMLRKRTEALWKLSDALQTVVDAVVSQVPNQFPTAEQEKEITRLRALTKLVQREPVWPFDVVTMRRFFTAYLAPVVASLLTLTPVKKPVEHLFDNLLRWPEPKTDLAASPASPVGGGTAPTKAQAPGSSTAPNSAASPIKSLPTQ